MILKNLFRRKGRTLLTLVGIAIGVAAIIALGAMAEGMRAGYTSMARGSQADLVLSQADAMDATLSGVEESVADLLEAWPEVVEVDGMLMGNVQTEGSVFFYIFGYDPEGFAIEHFRVIEGQTLGESRRVRGKPLLLGKAAADSLNKEVGDTLRITGGAFRIVGIYETGDAFEEAGAVIPLQEAQSLLLQPRRVSLYYVRLRDPSGEARLRLRVERNFPDLALSSTSEFADRQDLIKYLAGVAWAIAALAVIIGGLVMTNTLLMSVFERTREIGLLRAVGWRRGQVLRLILGESLVFALLGGLLGTGLGVAGVSLLRNSGTAFGAYGGHFTPQLFLQAYATVVVLGLVGGLYPAWWASRLLPLEALRYEGGAADRGADGRIAWAGVTVRNLLRRRTRTLLTSLAIGVGIAAIVALGGIAQGFMSTFTEMVVGSQADLMALEADASDMGYSTIDERVGARLAALPDVEAVTGVGFAFATTEETPIFFMMGYNPREFGIQHFKIVEGRPLSTNRQMLIGRQVAEAMGLEVGDTFRVLDSNFRIVGIYETGQAFEESGSVVTLRDAQRLAGRPHQVTMYGIRVRDPDRAEEVRDYLNAHFPEIEVSLSSEFAESIPDMERMGMMTGQIAFMAVFLGAVGMLNTMLMSVLERTREIGVLRALGWRRRQVVGMILKESLVLGLVGGVCGILLGMGLVWALQWIPFVGGMLEPDYGVALLVRALIIALVAGTIGGLYPAWRATRMRPVEALQYE
jgi:ABC-type antimicrobial peptide transport system permease subunit